MHNLLPAPWIIPVGDTSMRRGRSPGAGLVRVPAPAEQGCQPQRDADILVATIDPAIYEDTNSSGSFDPRADLDVSVREISCVSLDLVHQRGNHALRGGKQ